MKSVLKTLARNGDISDLSLYFAEFIAAQADQPADSLLASSAALVSEANQQGDVCVMLDRYQSLPLFHSERIDIGDLPVGPDLKVWRHSLLSSYCVGEPGETAPLIIEDDRLYLYRYWRYESELAANINARIKNPLPPQKATLLASLKSGFPEQAVSQQQLAVALAVKHRFAVISGGPGTGKTTTLVNILSVLQSQQADMRIKMAAPTGKAAARMMESIRQGLNSSGLAEDSRGKIPAEASTIHRLLGYRHDGFRYSRRHRLPLDCLIIDEASMVDLTMMYRLLDALPDDARVILLGDRDQLASVSAGNVFGDITGLGSPIIYSAGQIDWLNSIFQSTDLDLPTLEVDRPMADSIALLKQSYRFDAHSRIGKLAQLVNQGDSGAAISLLEQAEIPLQWFPDPAEMIDRAVLDEILNRYQAVVKANSIEEAFEAFESYRVLCAVHSGPFGVDEINRRIEESLHARGLIEPGSEFHGKPVLIQSNDYELALFNGDIGLLWRDDDNKLCACFRDIDHGIRRIWLTSLPAHSPAWAMTVHKSQGSEFDAVLLVLPEPNQRRALSRELLYTGITRTRRALAIYASAALLEYACASPSQRHSGLAAKLGW